VVSGVPGNSWDVLDGVEPAEHPLVSVVVVHYEQPADLARTLQALERQSYAPLEVIVVDDGSADHPVVGAGVRLITLPDRGFRAAAARNAGAAAARGDVLCFLDADTSPEPGYVAALTRLPLLCSDAVTVGRRRHADFGRASGDDADADDLPVEVAGPAAELTEPAWLRDAYAESRNLLDADQRSYRFVISSVLACSRAFFELTGGFDERFDRYGGEDWEWANRAYRLGAVLAHVPEAVAWHAGPDLADRLADRTELVRRKNAEALVLLNRIGVVATRERGVRSAAVDVVVELPPAGPAATVVCADVVLAALPQARVVVDDAVAEVLRGDGRVVARSAAAPVLGAARVVVRCEALFTVQRADRRGFAERLAGATEQVGVARLGWVELAAPASDEAEVRVVVASMRAEHRRQRWPEGHGFVTEEAEVVGMKRLPEHPDLEAHLSGWSD
jgi:GT2 family glycosyltransferase